LLMIVKESLTPAVPKAVLLPPSTQAGLFASAATAPPSRQMAPRPRVLKSSSGLLYDALTGLELPKLSPSDK